MRRRRQNEDTTNNECMQNSHSTAPNTKYLIGGLIIKQNSVLVSAPLHLARHWHYGALQIGFVIYDFWSTAWQGRSRTIGAVFKCWTVESSRQTWMTQLQAWVIPRKKLPACMLKTTFSANLSKRQNFDDSESIRRLTKSENNAYWFRSKNVALIHNNRLNYMH